MIFNLTGIGFILSLDNFRTALTLGPLRFGWRRCLLIATVFGLFDALAPLAGLLLAGYVRQEIAGPVSDIVGPAVLGGYGLYIIVQESRAARGADRDYLWSVLGLPVPLSLDNLIAGAGLGLAGLSPVVPAIIFGVTTFVMSLVGLQIGQGVSRLIPIRIRWAFVTGGALIAEAFAFGLGWLN
jgi:putative Mn2+ efflux pump MntP